MAHPEKSSPSSVYQYQFKASMDGQLTDEQVACFQQWGVLVLEKYFSSLQTEQLKERMNHLIQDFEGKIQVNHGEIMAPVNTDPYRYFYDRHGEISFFFELQAFDEHRRLLSPLALSLRRVSHGLHDLDPVFQAFSYQPKIKTTMQNLGYSSPILVQSMYLFKQPKFGSLVDGHQDATYLHSFPKPVIGLWCALEDAYRENGCLWVMPGRHHEPLRNKFVRYNDGSMDFEFFSHEPWCPEDGEAVEVPAGSLVLLHGHLPHGSYVNLSERSRHAYSLHCVDGMDSYPPTNWLQREKHNPFRFRF